jgi:two-component system sensor histidine kinase HydH
VVAGAYVALAGAWIVFSGELARSVAGTVEELERLERYKGIGFVAVTGLGLFLVAFVVLRRQAADAAETEAAREILLRSERNALAGLFVSSIAHDANNITMVVNSALDLIKEDPGLSPDNREALADAQSAMGTMTRLFSDLKEMGRDRNSRERIELDLRVETERIVALLRGHSALRHCMVTIDAPLPVSLAVFPVLIDQVLINLLLNGADATGGQGHLEVRLRPEGGEVRLEVHDDGEGLPPGMEDKLFKPFATTKPHGTGLGLVSVRECALAHGGRVEYARSPLGGAAFSVCLPLAHIAAAVRTTS